MPDRCYRIPDRQFDVALAIVPSHVGADDPVRPCRTQIQRLFSSPDVTSKFAERRGRRSLHTKFPGFYINRKVFTIIHDGIAGVIKSHGEKYIA